MQARNRVRVATALRRYAGPLAASVLAATVALLVIVPAAQAAGPSADQLGFFKSLGVMPVFGPGNPAAGALNQFEQFDSHASWGLMADAATLTLWGYWSAGLLMSGAGGIEVVESLVKLVLAGIGIEMWPDLFTGAVSTVNGISLGILNAPFAHHTFVVAETKLAAEIPLTIGGVAGATALAASFGKTLGIVGISLASFVTTKDPIAWFLDFVMVLLFLVGELIIQIERVVLFATTAFIFVTGPFVIALTAFRGLTPVTSAFFRTAMAVMVIVVVWAILMMLFAIMGTAIDPVWAIKGTWFNSIADNLSALVLLWMMILTPGAVRRQLGAGGGSALGAIRSGAALGLTAAGAFRVLRGGGAGRNPNRGAARRLSRSTRRAGAGRPTGTGGGGRRPTGSGAGRRPTGSGGGARPTGVGTPRRPNGSGAGGRPTGTGASRRPSGSGSGARPSGSGGGARPSGSGNGPRPSGSGSGARPSSSGSGVRPSGTNAGGPPSTGSGNGARPAGAGTPSRPAGSGGGPRPTGAGTPTGGPPQGTRSVPILNTTLYPPSDGSPAGEAQPAGSVGADSGSSSSPSPSAGAPPRTPPPAPPQLPPSSEGGSGSDQGSGGTP